MGQITGKDNNRVPTVEECNDAFGGDYMTESQVNEAISNATANFLSSSDFTMAWGSTSGDGANGYNYVYNVTRYGFEVSWDKSPGYYIAVGY